MVLRQRMKILVAFLPAAAGIWGCASTGQAQPRRLQARERPYLVDVPIPYGFRIVDEASEHRMTGRRRVYVRHVYEGHADIYDVQAFFVEHMAQTGWQLVHSGSVKGQHDMRFEKGSESCTLKLTPASRWSDLVRIEAMILQEERGQPSSKKRPS